MQDEPKTYEDILNSNASEVEELISQCFSETEKASRENYDFMKADKTAALFLTAQYKLSLLIEDIEFDAKNSKNEVSRLEGEKYFEFKTENADKKTTDSMINAYIAKSQDIIDAKKSYAKNESILKKYNFILNTLKDGHVYFRNLNKNKSWQE
jgi:hypothetical protein